VLAVQAHPVQCPGNAVCAVLNSQLCRMKAAFISVGVSVGDEVSKVGTGFSSTQRLSLFEVCQRRSGRGGSLRPDHCHCLQGLFTFDFLC